MAPGDVFDPPELSGLSYVDTGMYDTPEYGSVYLVDGAEPTLVDTGIGTNHERVLDLLEAAGLDREDLATIAVTHVHLDHAGGAGHLAAECPNATVAVHERGARHLVDPDRLWAGTKAAVGDQIEYYTEPRPVPEDRVRELEDGDRLPAGDGDLSVHHAPGHAPHQVVFEHRGLDAVFTADAAGIYVPSLARVEPTTPPPQFDLDRAVADARSIAALDPSWLCFAHFGPVETDDLPARYVRALRTFVETVRETRAETGDDEATVSRLVEERTPERAPVWGERKARGETAMNVRGALDYLED